MVVVDLNRRRVVGGGIGDVCEDGGVYMGLVGCVWWRGWCAEFRGGLGDCFI